MQSANFGALYADGKRTTQWAHACVPARAHHTSGLGAAHQAAWPQGKRPTDAEK